MEVPEQFKRDTIDESFEVVLESFNSAYRKISEQGLENRQLRDEIARLQSRVAEMTARLEEFESRDASVAMLAALADGGVR